MVGQVDPLHIAGVVRASRTQRHDVVDLPARAGASRAPGGRAGVLGSEGPDLGLVPRNLRYNGKRRQKRRDEKQEQPQVQIFFPFQHQMTRPRTWIWLLPSRTSTAFTFGLSLVTSNVPPKRSVTRLMNTLCAASRT